MFEPYPWQVNDVSTLRKNGYTGLLNIEPGGTKTAISCLSIKDSGADVVLISAPKNTFSSAWTPTVNSILDTETRIVGNSLKAEKQAFADFELGVPGIYLTTPQLLTRSDTRNWSGDMLIADEIHQLASPGSRGQRTLSGFNPAQDGEPLSRRFDSRLALSGTPARQNFENMWSTMRFLWPELYRRGEVAYDNYWAWLAERMTYDEIVTKFEWIPIRKGRPVPDDVRFKTVDGVKCWGKVTKVKKWLTEREPGLLISEAPCVITHYRRQECCAWHPEGFLDLEEPQILERVVELASAQKKAIRELENHYVTWLGDNPLVTDLTITQQQRIRQICLGVPFVTYSEDGQASVEFDDDCLSPFLDELLSILASIPDEPVLVLMDSQRFAAVTTTRLNKAGITAAEYSGRTVKNRDEYLRLFGDQYRVLVGVTSAVGVGTDSLQEKCSTDVFLEIPISLTNKTQAESRTDRIGARKQVQRYIIKDSEGYAEGRLMSHVQTQLELNRSLKRGV